MIWTWNLNKKLFRQLQQSDRTHETFRIVEIKDLHKDALGNEFGIFGIRAN